MYGQEGPRAGEPYSTERNSDRPVEREPLGGKGFFSSLFDFSFSYFVTPQLVRLAYMFAVLGAGLLGVAGLLAALARGGGTAFAALIFIPLVFLAWAAYVRIILEIFIVVFRIAEPVREAASSLEELKRMAEDHRGVFVPTSGSGRDSTTADPGSGGKSSSAVKTTEGGSTSEAATIENTQEEQEPGSTVGRFIAPEGYRFCVECGEQNKVADKFCSSCGADLKSPD